ncbi:MAG: hypothetical protein ACR650_02675 [Methylocystis sp.]
MSGNALMNGFLLSSFRLMAFVLFLSSALGVEEPSSAFAAEGATKSVLEKAQ